MLQQVENPTERPRLTARLAAGDDEIREAQRLRYRVFAGEMEARLSARGGEVDRDGFDEYCDHLLVCDRESDRVVGTYRILPGDRAEWAGGFYSETEFDLPRLRQNRRGIVEVGRACVDPEYRNGAVLWQLWAGLARYVVARECELVIGCPSIPLSEGGNVVAGVCRRLKQKHLSPPEWRARPRRPFPLTDFVPDPNAPIPALIEAYVGLGAWICGDPAWDMDFNTADVLMLLPMAQMSPRYLGRLLRAA